MQARPSSPSFPRSTTIQWTRWIWRGNLFAACWRTSACRKALRINGPANLNSHSAFLVVKCRARHRWLAPQEINHLGNHSIGTSCRPHVPAPGIQLQHRLRNGIVHLLANAGRNQFVLLPPHQQHRHLSWPSRPAKSPSSRNSDCSVRCTTARWRCMVRNRSRCTNPGM